MSHARTVFIPDPFLAPGPELGTQGPKSGTTSKDRKPANIQRDIDDADAPDADAACESQMGDEKKALSATAEMLDPPFGVQSSRSPASAQSTVNSLVALTNARVTTLSAGGGTLTRHAARRIGADERGG